MEQYFRYGRAEKIPFYDCSASPRSHEDWVKEGWVSYPAGIACLSYGIITEVLYILAMISMVKYGLMNQSAYKIMFILGIYDILALLVNAVGSGYFYLVGGVFCLYPDLQYVLGSFGFGMWCGASMTCLILVLNRILDIWKPHIAEKLFGGYRTWFILLISLGYTLGVAFFSVPLTFHSARLSWFFDPFIIESNMERPEYHAEMHVFNNLGVVIFTSGLYVFLCFVLATKYSTRESKMTRGQKSFIGQSTVICLVTLMADLGCVYMQFYPPPQWLVIATQVCWMGAHGIPAYVYLVMNKTIRRNIMRMLGLKEGAVGLTTTKHTSEQLQTKGGNGEKTFSQACELEKLP